MKQHKIISVIENSIAWEMKVQPGDILISINGQEIYDIMDYRFYMNDESILVEILKPDGEIWELEIEKEFCEEIGLVFDPVAVGEERHCANNCIFCFVDQQPPGLRETLYVKDDDPYQSFSQGNYITLTNLERGDIDQILKYKLSPMRISVHAGDMNLRRMMMGSIRAGYLFKILERFCEAGIDMHFQVVLCKGINDGAQLDKTIERLLTLGNRAKSLAIVPVGLTKYREGLFPLEGFDANTAKEVIARVKSWQEKLCKNASRFVFLADEWYVLADEPLPTYDEYEDFPQLDNGVGMMVLFQTQFLKVLFENQKAKGDSFNIGIVTGVAAGKFVQNLASRFMNIFPCFAIRVHVIQNDFYGLGVTVSGLLTGIDIISQLHEKCHDLDVLFIPGNAFRTNSDEMLCGTNIDDISANLGVAVIKGSNDGGEFCRQMINITKR